MKNHFGWSLAFHSDIILNEQWENNGKLLISEVSILARSNHNSCVEAFEHETTN